MDANMFFGTVRRCMGEASSPSSSDLEAVAAKIQRDCQPVHGGQPEIAGRLMPSELAFYQRAARMALEGVPGA
jgi:hypothetical protein